MAFVRCFFLSVLIIPCIVFAQQNNSDSLYQKSRVFLADKDFVKAIVIAKQLVEREPQSVDYKIYLANLYSWNKNYDSAIRLLLPLTVATAPSEEAFQSICNAYLWKGDFEKSILVARQGLSRAAADSVFYLSNLAIAYEKTNRDTSSLAMIKMVQRIDWGNEKMLYLKSSILQKRKNLFSASYYNISFRAPYNAPQHIAFLEYKRNFSKAPFLVRLNYGQMFQKESVQLEFDLYPKISKNSYLYLNQAVSSARSVFPSYKAGLEYYVALPEHVTASAGARFLKFQTSTVWIGTAHIGYQFTNWQPNYRIFLTSLGGKQFLSHSLLLKRDFWARESFVQLEFQYGNMPYSFFTTNEISRINAYRFGLQYKFRFCNNFFLQPILMYEYEEYFPGLFRNRYNTQFILSHRF